ncbi:hypothetical protein [Fulvivirga sedimenti]|uniref:ABC transporter permease n=1 Tax=Fulvivirga sedimenti TaxID=2879465 RepID=A0A9X1HMF5_9BACT|nr:hypothetical protein [Fulvivirga sedimenti]MCA6073690.1 hypothetical protein [Fulvivirga sedimenti]
MLRLLRIDLRKLANYRPFWVLTLLYGFLIISIPITVIEFLKWLKTKGADFDGFDPMRIPILYFPDIWQNITYVYTLPIMKIFLAIIVIISISNEYSYKTVRQNIIDGFSRWEFLVSKLSTVVLLAIAGSAVVFITGLLTGMIYTPEIEMKYVLDGMEFVFAYFLDMLLYLVLAFFLTTFLKRSALTVFILLIWRPIEFIIIANIPDEVSWIGDLLPMQAAANLIDVPFPRYWFQEIADYIPYTALVIVLGYISLFVFLLYRNLRKSDL